MKYLDEYRDPQLAKLILKKINSTSRKKCVIMEVCGGQTHAITKYGIDQLLPDTIELVHGPGCPVCVTPIEKIDTALNIASQDNLIFTSFGDMLRVPGSQKNLLEAKSEGADVRMVYSPLDAIQIAKENKSKEVVFFAIGFETTAPLSAMTILQAHSLGLDNFTLLVSHVLVPPAIEAMQASQQNRINGYLAAGHVCTVTGIEEYYPLSEKFSIPIVVTGFEPVDILEGIYKLVKQIENNEARVENQYSRIVNDSGNVHAIDSINRVFKVTNQKWRGIGEIPDSGLTIKDEFSKYDAEQRFTFSSDEVEEDTRCIAGKILQGLEKPNQCAAFGTECTPLNPLGATMVSSEGACHAYYKYHQKAKVK